MENMTDLILNNEGLIYKIINKYRAYFELDDLYQVAVLGIIKAANNYKDEYNTKFTSYAYPYILGEVIRYINEYRPIKVSKNYKIIYLKIIKAQALLTQQLMKEPSITELSLYLEIDEKTIEDVLTANCQVDSLDKIISEDSKDLELYDKYGYIDSKLENYPLNSEIAKLDPKEREIIIARYYANMSQTEVANSLGMYQVEVSRTEKKILKKLKERIAA